MLLLIIWILTILLIKATHFQEILIRIMIEDVQYNNRKALICFNLIKTWQKGNLKQRIIPLHLKKVVASGRNNNTEFPQKVILKKMKVTLVTLITYHFITFSPLILHVISLIHLLRFYKKNNLWYLVIQKTLLFEHNYNK